MRTRRNESGFRPSYFMYTLLPRFLIYSPTSVNPHTMAAILRYVYIHVATWILLLRGVSILRLILKSPTKTYVLYIQYVSFYVDGNLNAEIGIVNYHPKLFCFILVMTEWLLKFPEGTSTTIELVPSDAIILFKRCHNFIQKTNPVYMYPVGHEISRLS